MPQIIALSKLILLSFLYIWFSFFAPLLDNRASVIFLSFFLILLLAVSFKEKSSYKTVFSQNEIPFLICMVFMLGGLITVKDQPLAHQLFINFIAPAPLFYFSGKILFEEENSIILAGVMGCIALAVCLLGMSEFIKGGNFIYKYFVNNIYYLVFKARRMISTQFHPTPLGTYFVAVLPLLIALRYLAKGLIFKLSAIIFSIIISIGIILTFSRGAFLAFFISISTMLFLLNKSEKKNYILKLLLICVIIIAIYSLLSYFGCLSTTRYSLQELSDPQNYSRKIDRFTAIWPILKDHPFSGLGFGHYRVFFDYYLPHLASVSEYDGKVADCMYITILTETGVLGFGAFLLFMYFIFKRAWIKLKILSKSRERVLLAAFLSGFIGILFSFLTYDGLYWRTPSYLFWSYAGILTFLSETGKKSG